MLRTTLRLFAVSLAFTSFCAFGTANAQPVKPHDALRKAIFNDPEAPVGGNPKGDVTIVAFEWETPDSFENTHGVSTDSISDGVFASTIQAGVLDTLVDDLDDAAIERSIAEINEAIRRSAAKKT